MVCFGWSTFEAITGMPALMARSIASSKISPPANVMMMIGLLRDGCLEVVELLLKVAVLLQEHHLAVGLDLAAGLVHALFHRLPEDVRRVEWWR